MREHLRVIPNFPKMERHRAPIFSQTSDVFTTERPHRRAGSGSVSEQARQTAMEKLMAKFGLPGESASQTLDRVYSVEKRSPAEMARISGAGRVGVVECLRSSNITLRTRKEAIKVFWSDTKRKDAAVAKLHSPRGSKNRTEAVRNFYNEKKKKRMEAITAAVGGESLEQGLGIMTQDMDLSDLEIARIISEKTGEEIKPSGVTALRRKSKIKPGGRKKLEGNTQYRPFVRKKTKEVVMRALAAGFDLDELGKRGKLLMEQRYLMEDGVAPRRYEDFVQEFGVKDKKAVRLIEKHALAKMKAHVSSL